MDMNTSNLLDFSLPPAPTATEAKKDDIILEDDDHSQVLLAKDEEKGFAKNSNSTDDFEHVDDFMLGNTKKPITENIKGATQDFLAFEQSGDFVGQPAKEVLKPVIPEQPAVIEKVEIKEIKKDDDNKKIDDIFSSSDIQSDYLNPYNDVMTKKPHEEKFISSEDLLNDFKDVVEDKDEEVVKDTRNILDTTVYDDTAPIQANPVVEPEPIIRPPTPEPVKPPTPEPPVVAPKPKPVVKPEPVKEEKLIEAEKMFKQFGLVESLIYWRDVKKSGIVFGSGLAVLIAMSLCSLISVFSYVSLVILFGTVAYRIYKNVLQAVQKTSEGHPFKEYLEMDLTLSQDRVQQIANVFVTHLNALGTELRRLFLVEDLVDSIKFGVLLYCLTYVGALFNGMTCVIIAFVALFTLPKVYENNKQSIDGYLDIVKSKIMEVTDKVKAAVPIGKKAAESDKDK